ncbi:MAG: hypothetical protein IJH04_00100 [Eggerthellaceae bacterium]|nr:hypothetical protein [Eggerthellaceae bacterium]
MVAWLLAWASTWAFDGLDAAWLLAAVAEEEALEDALDDEFEEHENSESGEHVVRKRLKTSMAMQAIASGSSF